MLGEYNKSASNPIEKMVEVALRQRLHGPHATSTRRWASSRTSRTCRTRWPTRASSSTATTAPTTSSSSSSATRHPRGGVQAGRGALRRAGRRAASAPPSPPSRRRRRRSAARCRLEGRRRCRCCSMGYHVPAFSTTNVDRAHAGRAVRAAVRRARAALQEAGHRRAEGRDAGRLERPPRRPEPVHACSRASRSQRTWATSRRRPRTRSRASPATGVDEKTLAEVLSHVKYAFAGAALDGRQDRERRVRVPRPDRRARIASTRTSRFTTRSRSADVKRVAARLLSAPANRTVVTLQGREMRTLMLSPSCCSRPVRRGGPRRDAEDARRGVRQVDRHDREGAQTATSTTSAPSASPRRPRPRRPRRRPDPQDREAPQDRSRVAGIRTVFLPSPTSPLVRHPHLFPGGRGRRSAGQGGALRADRRDAGQGGEQEPHLRRGAGRAVPAGRATSAPTGTRSRWCSRGPSTATTWPVRRPPGRTGARAALRRGRLHPQQARTPSTT